MYPLKQLQTKLADFKIVFRSIFFYGKFLKFLSSKNLPWGHVRPQTKYGPDRLSRFDVYEQILRQTNKVYIYIDVDVEKEKTRPTEKSEHGTALISISLYLSL